MCGRFAFFSPAEAIQKAFGIDASELTGPRYNIAPTQNVAAIIGSADGKEQGELELVHLRWGLVPFWAKDPSIGNKMINARAETVAEKPAYRTAFKRRRCMILADGFYEWQKPGHKKDAAEPQAAEKSSGSQKIPWFIYREDKAPFAMAGIWDTWDKGDEGSLHTCSIITAPANAFMADIHHRMPVILGHDNMRHWLAEGSSREALQATLMLPQAVKLTACSVSRDVNSPRNDRPELLDPVDY